jgi:Kef-type K+ transport system membrane component KefB
MNTRGLTELVVLSIGLHMKIIGEELYSLMVVMAVVTTAMAGPLLRRLMPRRFAETETVPPTPPVAGREQQVLSGGA